MHQPLIGINLLYIRPGYMGGTVRYAYELLRYFSSAKQFRWKVYVQKGVFRRNDPILKDLPKMEFSIVGGLAGRVFCEHLVLPFIARKDGVDLLFSPGFVTPLWGDFLKVVTIHDLYYKRFPGFVRLWQRRYWQIFVPASIYKSNVVIANSESTRRDICAIFPKSTNKVRRIYLGADACSASLSETPLDEELFCLVVGNMTPNKNIETVVTAFSLLSRRQKKIRLIIVGSDLFGRLSSALQQVDIDLDIKLLEYANDDMLLKLYQQACCLIQASYYEGFGLPAAEAMLRGCPVIASDVPVLREICGDAAVYFPPESADRLADAIQAFMTQELLREHHKTLGFRAANQFKWEQAAQETLEVFDTLLGQTSYEGSMESR